MSAVATFICRRAHLENKQLCFNSMASFGWKRKVGERVSRSVVRQFEAEEEKTEGDGGGGGEEEEEVDWLHAVKRRREVLLEDCAAKSRRLKDEGALLAEQGRSGHRQTPHLLQMGHTH